MTSYEISNKILTVAQDKFNCDTFKALLADNGDREVNSQNLLDYLCDTFKLPRVKVIIADQSRRISGRCETRGFIRFSGTLKSKYIKIYNFTAKQHKIVAIKTFAQTLLHEFMHHYDVHYLKIDTLHTAGFYTRISDLKAKLGG